MPKTVGSGEAEITIESIDKTQLFGTLLLDNCVQIFVKLRFVASVGLCLLDVSHYLHACGMMEDVNLRF